ncbi:hypothetical protein [Eubacterium sp.]|uniref:hypothetical protein n=1 Tax=Eubacterium sp. TaxID=142586 RepID=UPI001DF68EEC|nr:hypothetical protein [Eubacterium sp.]MBS5620769.1 hypothetical protein [Eubacterium sp.]
MDRETSVKKAFSVRFALVKKASKYKLLKNRFKVSENKDGASIKSYTVNSDDVIEYVGEDAYWKDGINFLRSAKITGGDTEYYVALFDSKRPIKKEDLD